MLTDRNLCFQLFVEVAGSIQFGIKSQDRIQDDRTFLYMVTLTCKSPLFIFLGVPIPEIPKFTHLSGVLRPNRRAPSAPRLRRQRPKRFRKLQFPSLRRPQARLPASDHMQLQRSLLRKNVSGSDLSQSLRRGNFEFGRSDEMTSGQQKNRCAKTCLHLVQSVMVCNG